MPKLTKMLRDLHTLRLEVEAEIARQGLPPGTTPEQLAALTTEAFEEGFTTGMNRKRGRKPGLKSKPVPKARKRRKAKKTADPKKAAQNLHVRTRKAIVEVLGGRALTRGQIAERSDIDPEMVSQCIHKERDKWFVETSGHRWRVNPDRTKLDEVRRKARKAVASGDRPTFRDAIVSVMGKEVMGPAEVLEGLEAAGKVPESNDPRHYINFTLCHYKDTFERVERGQYRVRS